MFPSQHAAITAATLVPLRARGWRWHELFLFWGGAVLIDVDHYVSYVWRTRDLSLWNAYHYHRGRVPRGGHFGFNPRLPTLWPRGHRPFHALSIIVLLFVVARWWRLLHPVALGVLYHRFQDSAWDAVTRPSDATPTLTERD